MEADPGGTTTAAPIVTGRMTEVADLPPVAAKAAEVRAVASVDAATLRTAGQRRVNMLWEGTQAFCAAAVTITTLTVAAYLAVNGDNTAFTILASLASSVIGTYFSRTNHTKTGGVGLDDVGR